MPTLDHSAAYHEAGHIVIGCVQHVRVLSATLTWDEEHQNWIGGTAVEKTRHHEQPLFAPDSFFRSTSIMNFAGCLAQAKFCSQGKLFDPDAAEPLLSWMLRQRNAIEQDYKLKLAGGDSVILEARSFAASDWSRLQNLQDFLRTSRLDEVTATMGLVEEHWDKITRVAEAFIARHSEQSAPELIAQQK